jgi:O-antigen/teichoic acid export membrane protein
VLRKELGDGAYFAVGAAAATFYNDIDKTMLARMSSLGATGIYGAAYRIVDTCMAPIKAMTAAAYAETFRRGAKGVEAAHKYALSLIRRAAWIGGGLFLLLFIGAPGLPFVIGSKFGPSVEALRWLAPLPFLRSWHYFLGDALSGAGLNATRTIIQVIVALVNIGLNLYFIRQWSWRGAAWTSLMCDGMLAVAFAVALNISKKRAPTRLIPDVTVPELSA